MIVARLLLGFSLTLHLLNLLLLIFDLPLLRTNLRLGLRLGVLVVLHLVAYGVSAQRTDSAADCGTCQRVADRGADDRACCGSHARADERAFLTGRERLSGASHDRHDRHRHEQTFDYCHRVCPHELSSLQREQFSCPPPAAGISQPTKGELIYPPLVFYVIRSQSTISNIDVSVKFLPISDFSLPP
jgi:hypothetical protein